MVANKGLENARAYLNQVPLDQRLNVPPEGHEGNPSSQFLGQGSFNVSPMREASWITVYQSFTVPPMREALPYPLG